MTAATAGGLRPALARGVVVVALLLGEVLLLTFLFESPERGGDAAGPGFLLGRSSALLRAALAVAFVTAGLAGWFLADALSCAAADSPSGGAVCWLAAHLLAFVAFVALTGSVLGPAPVGWPEALAWLVLAGLVVGSGAAAVIAPRHWPGLLRRGWGVVVAGLVVGVVAWKVAEATQDGWDVLSRPTLWLAYQLARLACPDVVCVPEDLYLGTRAFAVRVGAFCSGVEGIGLVLAYLTVYLVVMRRALRFPQALLLLPIGAVAAWLANAVRVAALLVIGDRFSPELALGGFHSQAGWLAFNVVALGLVLGAHCSRLFAAGAADADAPPTAAYLAPLLALVGVGLLSAALLNDAAPAYPLRVIAGAIALGLSWHAYAELRPGAPDWSAVLLGVGVFVLWRLLAPPAADPREGLAGLPPWAVGAWAAVRALGSVVVVPLAEEIAFRGYLLRRLIAADFRRVPPETFTWASFLVSSALFGLLHGAWLAGTLAGMAYAVAVYRRGRLFDAVIAHATTNGLLTGYALLSGDWRAWS